MNNYDHNSKGVSIEIEMYYTYNYWNFDENFIRIDGERYDKTPVYLYTDWNNLNENDIKIEIKARTKDLKRYLIEVEYYYEEMKRSEMVDEIFNLYTIAELLADEKIIEDLAEFNITIQTNATVEEFAGYSQGDLVKIILLRNELALLRGNFNLIDWRKEAMNIIYNPSLTGYIKIEDKEFDLLDITGNEYIGEDEAREKIEEWSKTKLSKEEREELQKLLDKIKVKYY